MFLRLFFISFQTTFIPFSGLKKTLNSVYIRLFFIIIKSIPFTTIVSNFASNSAKVQLLLDNILVYLKFLFLKIFTAADR